MLPEPLVRLVPDRLVGPAYMRLLSTPYVGDAYMVVNPNLRRQRVTSATDVVVDGFPRSANTFVSRAFAELLGGNARISSHTHSPRTVRRAARLGRPCVLLLRPPDDAVASLLTYDRSLTARSAFTAYARFYEPLVPLASDVVVGNFAEVVSSFSGLVARVNEQYGVSFPAPADDFSSHERIFTWIDDRAKQLAGTAAADKAPRPVPGRRHRSVGHPDPRWAGARARAMAAYEAIAAGR